MGNGRRIRRIRHRDAVLMGAEAEHVDRVLAAVRDYWTRHPDLRLGQLIKNAASNASYGGSVYFIKDSELLDGLAALNDTTD